MKSLLALSLLVLPASAFAEAAAVVYGKGAWELRDSIPNHRTKGTCQAMSAGSFGTATVYLSLVVDKSGASPLSVYVLPNRASVGVSAFFTKTFSGQTFTFPKLQRLGARDQYWQVPVDTARFVNDLKATRELTLRATGTSEQLRISLAGAREVLQELARRCGNNSLLSPAAFEKAFLPANKARFSALSPERASRLRAAVNEAVQPYYTFRAISLELQALENQFADLNRERGTLRSSLDQLNGATLPGLQSARDAAQAAIDQANKEITGHQGKIEKKQLELNEAKTIAGSEQERYRPLVPEHDRLHGLRAQNETGLSGARTRLADLDADIQRARQNIIRVKGEIDELKLAIPAAQEEVRKSKLGADGASLALKAYNFQNDFQERMRANPRLSQLERELSQSQLQMLELDDRARKQQAAVQAIPATAETKAQLVAAQKQLSQVQAQIRQATARQKAGQQELEKLRRAVRQQAELTQAAHKQQMSEWQSALSHAQAEMDDLQLRLAGMVGQDLPQAEKTFQDHLGLRAGALHAVQTAESNLLAATAELDTYKKNVNFEAIKKEAARTANVVSEIEATIVQHQHEIRSRQNLIQEQSAQHASLLKEITATQASIAAKDARLATVGTSLAAFDAQKKEIQGRLDYAAQILGEHSQRYSAALN